MGMRGDEAAGRAAGEASAMSEEEVAAEPGRGPAARDGAADAGVRAAAVTRVGYAPIVRVDAARRELELCATSEAIDSYGTVFDYEASKDAFTRWIGNVREMHERRAVGWRVGVRCDDESRRIFVTIRVSRGASNVVWRRQRRAAPSGARELDVATRYDLAELSLVDNPSNPDALGITFVRDAAPDLALLDRMEEGDFTTEDAEGARREEEIVYQQLPLPFQELRDALGEGDGVAARREGAGVAPAVQRPAGERREGVLHTDERLHAAARAVLAGCGCAVCAAALAALGVSGEANEGAMGERMMGAAGTDTSGPREVALVRALDASLRMGAGRLERVDAGMRDLREVFEAAVGRLVERMEGAAGPRMACCGAWSGWRRSRCLAGRRRVPSRRRTRFRRAARAGRARRSNTTRWRAWRGGCAIRRRRWRWRRS